MGDFFGGLGFGVGGWYAWGFVSLSISSRMKFSTFFDMERPSFLQCSENVL